MKTTLPLTMPRAQDEQYLMRLFSAGTGPNVPGTVSQLAFPCYHMTGKGVVTLAGDGRVFLWTYGRVPGFRDYVVPSPCVPHFEVPSLWRMRMPAGEYPCPEPQGAWGSGQCDEVVIGQHAARVRRWTLARLLALHACWLAPGERWTLQGMQVGWRTLTFTGKFGTRTFHGVIMGEEPGRLILARKVERERDRKRQLREGAAK